MAQEQSDTKLPAIVSPTVDFVLSGGGSIFVVLALLLVGVVAPTTPWLAVGFAPVPVLILQFALNMPHFLASYRLLYGRREQVQQHPFVGLYLPFLLFVVCVYALLTPGLGPNGPSLANVAVINLFGVLTTLLLAWHYTGQAWGMVASFAFMGGVRMDNTERLLIRAGLQILLVWHVLWGVKQMFGPLDWDPSDQRMPWVEAINEQLPEVLPFVHQAYDVWSIIAVLSVPVGIYGFVRIYRRTGRALPLRSVAPWVAIHMWYLLVWAYPGLFLLLQIFHAMQYLAFPMRVEVNQFVERHPDKQGRKVRHVISYYLALLVAGFVVFGLPEFGKSFGDPSGSVSMLVAGFVNMHHYFMDGVLWKIRNPEVRRALFAHLTPGTAKGPS